MTFTDEQKKVLTDCVAAVEPINKIFRPLFWAWHERLTHNEIKELREFLNALAKAGSEVVPTVMAMLYLGRDVTGGKISIQKPNGDYYVLSVIEEVQNEMKKFRSNTDPYQTIFDSHPDDLCDWLKKACEIVTEADELDY